MKKILTLLAVTMLPATFGGCAACSPGLGLCPCCPCNWCRREPACPPPPAPVCCPPATTYATPVATTCPPPCAPACPTCPPVASQMMPQYVMPGASPLAAMGPGACSSCQGPMMAAPQPMYYQQPQQMYFESSCGCSAAMMEPGCGSPGTVIATYGPFDMGPCSSGCCDAGGLTPPPAEGFVEPRPGE